MRVGLTDLLAPQFLAGLQLPAAVDEILSFLRVNELQSAWDESGVVYSGKAQFVGEGQASPVPRYRDPAGSVFEWEDVYLQFRLTIPRTGATLIRDAVASAASAAGAGSQVAEVQDALNTLEVVAATDDPSDYPGVAFRLELMLSAITLHLPADEFLPAKVGADRWLVPDTDHENVRFTLPKIAMNIVQGDTIGDIDVKFRAWGINSLDDPADLEAGELISMTPPLCLHKSRTVGFGLEKAVLDLSGDFTPPDILENFGTGDDFEGLWLPHVRIFVAPSGTTGFAFDVRANDLLIDFDAVVSGEFAADIMRRNDKLSVTPRLFEGDHAVEVTRGEETEAGQITTVTGSRASIAADGELQLAVTGGQPQYTITVRLDGVTISPTPYEGDSNRLRWELNRSSAASAELQITVKDSSSPQFEWRETIQLELREAGTVTGRTTTISPAALTPGTGTDGYTLALAASQPDVNSVILQATPPTVTSAEVVGSGSALTVSSTGQITVPVTPGDPAVTIEATWNIPAVSQSEQVRFPFAEPETDLRIDTHVQRIVNNDGSRLTSFLERANGSIIALEGHSSYQGDERDFTLNQNLAVRRAETLRRALTQLAADRGLSISLNPANMGHGTEWANGTLAGRDQLCGTYSRPTSPTDPPGPPTPDYNADCYQIGIASYSAPATTATRQVSVQRASTTTVHRTPTERGPAPNPPDRPPIFRRIGFRIRLERNQLVLGEVSGELDFQTQAEETAASIRAADSGGDLPGGPPGLTPVSQPGATASDANPGDGIVDFRLTVSYDTATQRLFQELALGAGASDRDGLLHLDQTSPEQLGNVVGALLSFSPLLADSIDAAVTAEGDDAIVPMVVSAVETGIAITMGLTGAFKTKKIILFGGQLNAVQSVGDQVTFDEAAILFDFAVDFEIDIDVGIHIRSTPGRNLRIRYRALGLKAEFDNGVEFSPVFDSSKGYQFDLADPGLFNVPAPLGDILKVLGARVARTNPLTLELDLGLKVNLGIISVDSVRVTVPIDPPSAPSLIPTGLSVDIPGALAGKGFLDLRNGIKGQLDLTIVPVKLRVMGGIAIESLDDPPRKLTALYVSLIIEFPSAIPIANTGLGLYGVLGLFAMHYKRDENPAAQVPALDWLNTKAHGNATELTAWVANPDRWAFGIGAILGTMEGGVILNLKGMLMLELPGPRILIFVNAQLLQPRPPTKGVVTLGILAVVDLNFVTNKLTIGLIIAYEIKDLLSVKIPIEAGFSFESIHDWNLYIGSIDAPASVEVLGIVKAKGYLMFDGVAIDNFPGPDGPIQLQGLAAALGFRASVILGDEDIGLYLEVMASLNVGLSFSPFHVYGILELRGKLHLFIISISAWARLTAEAPDPTYLEGEACGEIDFFFFSIEGCVRIRIGDEPPIEPPPDLITGMILQSRSPALIQGQGTDRPIDASLGEAHAVENVGDIPTGDELVVPIDSIPIVKMAVAPQEDGSFTTFTKPLVQAPRLFPEGWVRQGNNREIRYTLLSLAIDPPLPSDAGPPLEPIPLGPPPAVWWAPRNEAVGVDTTVDLRLFSWTPDHTPRAVQRSQELTERVYERWGIACDPVAPETTILWTFNPEQLGPSPTGWNLDGIPWPDPPGTLRSGSPDTELFVREPQPDPQLPTELIKQIQAMLGINIEPAKVIGDDPRDELFLPGDPQDTDLKLLGRVLQFPYEHLSEKIDIDLPAEYHDFFPKDPQRIIIESGPSEMVRLLVAVHEQGLDPDEGVVVRMFDRNDVLIEEKPMVAFIVTPVNSLANVPPNWSDPVGPWRNDVEEVLNYVLIRQRALIMFLLEWNPPPDTDRIELLLQSQPQNEPPAVLLCAIELLREDERIRAIHDSEGRQAMIDTVEASFHADELRRLLVPGTRYTISMTYKAEAREKLEDGSYATAEDTRSQHFSFKTDDVPPERLDPWILATTPHRDDFAHFVDDPIQVYFNDESAIQLFETYGSSLKAVIRKANGDHPTDEPPITLSDLEATDPAILPPFDETIEILVNDELHCITGVVRRGHRRFTVPIPLERGTSYTLDIESDGPAAPPDEPKGFLFRTAFTTSRFLSAAELAGAVEASRSAHRLLRAPLPLLDQTPSDAEIENAFMAAGLETIAPSSQPGITFLWEAPDRLVAILLDSPEPLWRFRLEPEREVIESDSGDMEHWRLVQKLYLEVVEVGTTAVSRFVRSPGGTRTLVVLNPGASELTLKLRQHEHSLSSATPGSTEHILMSSILPMEPPWRLNNV